MNPQLHCHLRSSLAAIYLCLVTGFGAPAHALPDGTSKDNAKTTLAVTYTGPKKRLAVMNMEAGTSGADSSQQWAELFKQMHNIHTVSDVGRKLTEMLTTALNSTGRFVLVDRANIQDIRDEIKVGEELGNEKSRVRSGNVLGAQILVRCAVTEFTDNKSVSGGGIHIGGLRIGGGEKVAAVTVDIKMVDASTSRVLYTESASGDSKSQAAAGGIRIGSFGAVFGKSTNEPIEKATRAAIQKAVDLIVARMEAIPWEGRVALIDTGEAGSPRIVINRGTEDGLHEGDHLCVYHAGKTIEDPETGEILGRDKDVLLGDFRIVWADKRVARLEGKRSLDCYKGDIVKLAESKTLSE